MGLPFISKSINKLLPSLLFNNRYSERISQTITRMFPSPFSFMKKSCFGFSTPIVYLFHNRVIYLMDYLQQIVSRMHTAQLDSPSLFFPFIKNLRKELSYLLQPIKVAITLSLPTIKGTFFITL